MKRTFLLLSIFIAGSIFANNDCIACDDCISYETKCSVLYLQPNSSNLYYGAEAFPLPLPSPSWESLEIKPDFHFGFDLGIKALFNRACTNLALNWERLHSSDSSSKNTSIENMFGPYFNIGPEELQYTRAKGHVDHQFDAVHLDFGKQFDCSCFESNVFAGIGFTRIKQTMTSYFSNIADNITRKIEAPSLFIGAGPEFGVDFAYNFCHNLSFTGESSVALLFGKLKNSTTYISTFPEPAELDIPSPNKQKTNVPNRTQLVPAFSGKLGFSFERCCNSCLVTIDLGYQAEVYINAIQSVDMTAEVPTDTQINEIGVYALGFQRTVSNFLLSGPYLTLNVQF